MLIKSIIYTDRACGGGLGKIISLGKLPAKSQKPKMTLKAKIQLIA